MHFDGDLHAMIGGKFSMLRPIGSYHFVPLPIEDLAVFRRPGTGNPIWADCARGVTRTAGEIHNHRDAQLLGQENSSPTCFAVLLGQGLVRVQRVAVTAQGAYAATLIGQHFLKLCECGAILQHR